MNSRIDWVCANCRVLAGISEAFKARKPFAGLTIGTGIHLEPHYLKTYNAGVTP